MLGVCLGGADTVWRLELGARRRLEVNPLLGYKHQLSRSDLVHRLVWTALKLSLMETHWLGLHSKTEPPEGSKTNVFLERATPSFAFLGPIRTCLAAPSIFPPCSWSRVDSPEKEDRGQGQNGPDKSTKGNPDQHETVEGWALCCSALQKVTAP